MSSKAIGPQASAEPAGASAEPTDTKADTTTPVPVDRPSGSRDGDVIILPPGEVT